MTTITKSMKIIKRIIGSCMRMRYISRTILMMNNELFWLRKTASTGVIISFKSLLSNIFPCSNYIFALSFIRFFVTLDRTINVIGVRFTTMLDKIFTTITTFMNHFIYAFRFSRFLVTFYGTINVVRIPLGIVSVDFLVAVETPKKKFWHSKITVSNYAN